MTYSPKKISIPAAIALVRRRTGLDDAPRDHVRDAIREGELDTFVWSRGEWTKLDPRYLEEVRNWSPTDSVNGAAVMFLYDLRDVMVIADDVDRLWPDPRMARNRNDGELDPRQRNSLLKMVLGMAIDKYGFEPRAARSATAGKIAGALLTRGVKIDEETVRSHLKAAVDAGLLQDG